MEPTDHKDIQPMRAQEIADRLTAIYTAEAKGNLADEEAVCGVALFVEQLRDTSPAMPGMLDPILKDAIAA